MRPRRSHLVHPLPSRTYDAEQSTRCPLLDKQCSSAIIISKTVICRLKYPNRRPRQLQFRVTSVGRGAFEVPDQTTTYVMVVRDGGVLCGRCDFSCYVCVVASAAAASNDRRCTNYRDAGVLLAAPTATAVCGIDVLTADASACGCRSARILKIRRLTRTARPRKFADAD